MTPVSGFADARGPDLLQSLAWTVTPGPAGGTRRESAETIDLTTGAGLCERLPDATQGARLVLRDPQGKGFGFWVSSREVAATVWDGDVETVLTRQPYDAARHQWVLLCHLRWHAAVLYWETAPDADSRSRDRAPGEWRTMGMLSEDQWHWPTGIDLTALRIRWDDHATGPRHPRP